MQLRPAHYILPHISTPDSLLCVEPAPTYILLDDVSRTVHALYSPPLTGGRTEFGYLCHKRVYGGPEQ